MALLQDIRTEDVREANPDVLVVDYSWDGGADREMTALDVEALRVREGPDRIVLAYLSIGEAEDYRFYWKGAANCGLADFIVKANPRWRGNYMVRYWYPKWHDVLYGEPDSYLSRILDKGFDGVFLDTVDIAEVHERAGLSGAFERMAELIRAIATAGRAADPGFLVMAQNPYGVLGIRGVVDALSGVSAEAVFFRGERPASLRSLRPVIEMLRRMQERGKAVAVIEYVRSQRALKRFQSICSDNRFMCYAGSMSLSGIGRILEGTRGREEAPDE